MKNKWMSRISRFLASCLMAAATATCGSDISITSQDGRFVHNFSEIILEVENMAQLAQAQGQDPQVRLLGQRLLQDYSAIGRELANDAQAAGLGESPQLSAKAARILGGLSARAGSQFDQAVVRELFNAQQYAAHEMDFEMRGGGNVSWRQLAAVMQTALAPDLRDSAQFDALFNGHS